MAKVVREEDIFSESGETSRRTGTSESAILRQQTGLSSLGTTLAALQAMLAPGLITPFAGTAAPSGWLMCNGQSVSTTTYAALFAIIGTTYGGSGGNFNVPDLRGRTAQGLDNLGGAADAGRLAAANTLGGSGGVETQVLGATQVPAHTHSVNINSGPIAGSNHNHSVGPYGMIFTPGTGNCNVNAGTAWTAGAGFTTGLENQNHFHNVAGNTGNPDAGSNAAVNMMQPYILLNYLIKT